MMSYGTNWIALLTRAADYVARVLNGEKPAEIPVEQPTRFELVFNHHVAGRLGITLPQTILLQATELIR
jgi:putative ABC transport system substrate-binding protein